MKYQSLFSEFSGTIRKILKIVSADIFIEHAKG